METKPGIKTSEFWLAFAVTLAGAFAAAYSSEPWAQAISITAAALASAGYSFARANTKVGGQ